MDDIHSGSTYILPDAYGDSDRIVLTARDPHCLYTYWEISSASKDAFSYEFGHELWERSVPVLKVINISKNSSFYEKINDLANNWYINVGDAGCLYAVEIGRRVSDKFFISLGSSNYTLTPSDNLSTNTTAYFTDYNELGRGIFDSEASRIYATYGFSPYLRDIFGASSLELFGITKQELIFGVPNSAEFLWFDFQNHI